MTDFPATPQARQAGMAAFRAKMLAAHEKALAAGVDDKGRKLKPADLDFQRGCIATIKAAQKRLGEVK